MVTPLQTNDQEQEYQQKKSFNDVKASLCRCCTSAFDISCASHAAQCRFASSCFSQHQKHSKKLSNTLVKDKALGFQLHQQPRQPLSVFLVLANLFVALHSKKLFRNWGVPVSLKTQGKGNVAETHTTMGIITRHTSKYNKIIGKVYYDTALQNARILD